MYYVDGIEVGIAVVLPSSLLNTNASSVGISNKLADATSIFRCINRHMRFFSQYQTRCWRFIHYSTIYSVRNREVLFLGGSLIISRGEPTTPP